VSEIDQGTQGYPEEAPPGADPGGGDHPDETAASDDAERAPDQDDGKATGNPHTDD
jgi:hypothetical protein